MKRFWICIIFCSICLIKIGPNGLYFFHLCSEIYPCLYKFAYGMCIVLYVFHSNFSICSQIVTYLQLFCLIVDSLLTNCCAFEIYIQTRSKLQMNVILSLSPNLSHWTYGEVVVKRELHEQAYYTKNKKGNKLNGWQS